MLKVGELARKTGLTVRTLHHYDDIGLLTPSARSDAGYRLYTEADVIRLHAIQALRQLGLSLGEIAEMLANPDVSLSRIVIRQMAALDEEITRAQNLRSQLNALHSMIAVGKQPGMGEWLDTLESMATYGKYFSTDELAKIFRDWKKLQAEWWPLIEVAGEAMEQDAPIDSLQVQALAQRWMDLSMQSMQNDLRLAMRWGEMAEQEPAAPGPAGIDAALIRYIGGAINLRMEAFQRHLSKEDLQRLDKSLAPEWAALAERANRLMKRNVSPDSKEAQALGAEWSRLIDRATAYDPGLRERFMAAYREEPLLRMGHVISDEIRDFIENAANHRKTA